MPWIQAVGLRSGTPFDPQRKISTTAEWKVDG